MGKPGPRDWRCASCSNQLGRDYWVWSKKNVCGRIGCQCKRGAKSKLYGSQPEEVSDKTKDKQVESLQRQLDAAKRKLQDISKGKAVPPVVAQQRGECATSTTSEDELTPSLLDQVKQREKELQMVEKALKDCPSSTAFAAAKKLLEEELETSRKQMRDAKDPADKLRSKADRAAKHPVRLAKIEAKLREAIQQREDANSQVALLREDAKKELAEQVELQKEIVALTQEINGASTATATTEPPLSPASVQKWLLGLRDGFASQAASKNAPQQAVDLQKEVDGKLEQVLQVLLAISAKGKELEESVTMADTLAAAKDATRKAEEGKKAAEAEAESSQAKAVPPAPPNQPGDKKRLSDTTLAELLLEDGGGSTKWLCSEAARKDANMDGDV